jgi:hypothetical protein
MLPFFSWGQGGLRSSRMPPRRAGPLLNAEGIGEEVIDPVLGLASRRTLQEMNTYPCLEARNGGSRPAGPGSH